MLLKSTRDSSATPIDKILILESALFLHSRISAKLSWIFETLFLQASLHTSKVKEPLLRYGIVEKIFNMSTWKGIRFDDYFRMILAELHASPGSNPVKASHCEARVQCVEKPLLDVREDSDVVDLAQQISEQYGELMLK